MKIAVTRLAGKEKDDEELFASYGHSLKIISPLIAEPHSNIIQQFVLAANSSEFDALFFTSAYAAQQISPLLDHEISKSYRVIGIGPKTTEILLSFGIRAEMMHSFYSRDFVGYLGDWIKGKRIGIPRADVPNPKLIHAINESGGLAYEFKIYSLEPSKNPLNIDGCDAILFTSSKSFKEAILPKIEGIVYMAIGEITAETMRNAGCNPVIVGDGSLKGTLDLLNRKLPKLPFLGK